MSRSWRTNDIPTRSACRTINSRSSRSFGVSAGRLMLVSGRLIPLSAPRRSPFALAWVISMRSASGSTSLTTPPILPSSNQIFWPARTVEKISGSVQEIIAGVSVHPVRIDRSAFPHDGFAGEQQEVALMKQDSMLARRQISYLRFAPCVVARVVAQQYRSRSNVCGLAASSPSPLLAAADHFENSSFPACIFEVNTFSGPQLPQAMRLVRAMPHPHPPEVRRFPPRAQAKFAPAP